MARRELKVAVYTELIKFCWQILRCGEFLWQLNMKKTLCMKVIDITYTDWYTVYIGCSTELGGCLIGEQRGRLMSSGNRQYK